MIRFILSICLFLWCSTLAGQSLQTPEKEVDVYSYRMKGKVRLLFFWVGKDDVGGGTITVSRTPPAGGTAWKEEVEVLFGSNPDRVPGKINRWGYGREESVWATRPQESTATDLQSTTFEGFMKHSKEESLSEVQKNNSEQQENQEFLYDGIRSYASRGRAEAEIRTFATPTDFRYEGSAPVHCGYRERLKQGGPDRVRKLNPVPETLQHPYGFLTSIQSLIRQTMDTAETNPNWKKLRSNLHYTYNGREYNLEIRDLETLKSFELPLREGETRDGRDHIPVQNVVKADFRITNLEKDETHDFTLWFPLQGRFRGVPVRIVDKPRWWLRIELNLEPFVEAVPPRDNINCIDTLAAPVGN